MARQVDNRAKRKEKMTFDDTCILLKQKIISHDKIGNKIYSEEKKTEIFCNVNSVDRNQFYNAGAKGFKLSYIITINEFEYDDEEKLIYNNEMYDIVRTYELDNGLLELTIGEKIGGKL